jgi:RimJ/RimL family protein N-acetyltransferase
MKITFEKLINPNPEIVRNLNKWANDPLLVPLIRRCRNKADLDAQVSVTVDSVTKRLKHNFVYLIYVNDNCVGEMSFQLDSTLLYKKEPGSAWVGIGLGEASVRGKGLGMKAMDYLEKKIYAKGLRRIELGVFAFNTPALKLYKKLGYQEIARDEAFTYWQGSMWHSIRMEKHL